MIRYVDQHQKILDNNITLLIFAGNFDGRDGPYGIQEWMKSLKWGHMSDFHSQPVQYYKYLSDDDGSLLIGGNFKRYKNLNFLTVYAAGHMVPATQLALSRRMLSNIINDDGLEPLQAFIK